MQIDWLLQGWVFSGHSKSGNATQVASTLSCAEYSLLRSPHIPESGIADVASKSAVHLVVPLQHDKPLHWLTSQACMATGTLQELKDFKPRQRPSDLNDVFGLGPAAVRKLSDKGNWPLTVNTAS